jgi:hypothetical protein
MDWNVNKLNSLLTSEEIGMMQSMGFTGAVPDVTTWWDIIRLPMPQDKYTWFASPIRANRAALVMQMYVDKYTFDPPDAAKDVAFRAAMAKERRYEPWSQMGVEGPSEMNIEQIEVMPSMEATIVNMMGGMPTIEANLGFYGVIMNHASFELFVSSKDVARAEYLKGKMEAVLGSKVTVTILSGQETDLRIC